MRKPKYFFRIGILVLLAGAVAAAQQTPGQGADTLAASRPQTGAADTSQQKPDTSETAGQNGVSVLQWIEEHPVLFGGLTLLIGTIIGAIIGVRGMIAAAKIQRERKAAAEKKITAEVEKAKIQAKREAEEEIQIEADDEHERRYLTGLHKKYHKIDLYGFQSTANLKVRTLEVFVSLRLSEEPRDEVRAGITAMTREELAAPSPEDSRHLTPEQVLGRAARLERLLLIIGDPGSGKTTLLKYYAMCCLNRQGWKKLGLKKRLIPILVPLSKVDPAKPFTEALSVWGSGKHWHVSPELFDQWLHQRGALVMLDGLDEISDLGQRKKVCEWIDDACDYYGNSRFVVTSRYAGYRSGAAQEIELHTDHLRADVLGLDRSQQETFLKKWFTAAYKEELEASERSPAEAEKEIAEQAREIAEGVLEYLKPPQDEAERRKDGLWLMAGTPVLLQIIAILWKEFGKNLPPSRADLYERCTDYLLDRRDRVRGINPLLPADQAKIVLRPVCLWMQEIHQSDEVSAAELEERIAPLLEDTQPGLKAGDFIVNLRDRAGIIQAFGDDGFVFRHKSFREFLAAGQLAEEVKSNPERVNILVQNFAEGWWRETLVFALSLPRPVIFTEFLERFLPHSHNNAGFPTLLEQVIKEARHKPIHAFGEFVLDEDRDWQQRYNALHCLRLIASDPAKKLVQKVWELEKNEQVKQKAEEMLIEWELLKPAEAAPEAAETLTVTVRGKKQQLLQRIYNPHELNAEYILIPGGKYRYSVTEKEVEVPPVYFAKYPLTNKLYRRFIDYLAEAENLGETLRALPREQFAASLLEKAQTVEGFAKYLGNDPGQWARKLLSQSEGDKRFNGDDQPVVNVTWFDATAYCVWLTNLELAIANYQLPIANSTLLYRLPKEEEWEWAAGGGERQYPWGNEAPDDARANYGEKVGQTTPVGAYPAGATPEGLMDLAGNVWEWCENLYGKGAYREDARSLRGGSWLIGPDLLRCSARYDLLPDLSWLNAGFRVVRAQS